MAFKSMLTVDAAVAHAAVAASFAAVSETTGFKPAFLRQPRRRSMHSGEARRRAIYLAVVAYDCSQRAVSRALGVSPKSVRKILRRVEEERDDPTIDAWLDAMERRLCA